MEEHHSKMNDDTICPVCDEKGNENNNYKSLLYYNVSKYYFENKINRRSIKLQHITTTINLCYLVPK